MSSLATSSPVSASTLAYLIRCPVWRLSWLNEIFSDSEVAGYSATGQVTSERRRKPFQLARGAMNAILQKTRAAWIQDERDGLVPTCRSTDSSPTDRAAPAESAVRAAWRLFSMRTKREHWPMSAAPEASASQPVDLDVAADQAIAACGATPGRR